MHKRTEVFVLLLLIAIIVAMTTLTRREDNDTLQMNPSTAVPSSYRTLPHGYKALFLTLQESGYPVHRQIRPYSMLPKEGMLIVADPYAYLVNPYEYIVNGAKVTPQQAVHPPLTGYEGRELLKWIERGNIALFLLETHPDFLNGFYDEGDPGVAALPPSTRDNVLMEVNVEEMTESKPPAPVKAVRFTGEASPLESLPPLQIRSSYRFSMKETLPKKLRARIGKATPLYRDDEGIVAAYSAVGKGGIIWCSSPWSFSNAGLAKGQNLDVLLAIADRRPGGPVIFDEYHHGHGANMSVWNLAPAMTRLGIIQFGLALLLLLVTLAWRFGPPRLPAEDRFTRSRAEYLTSMAALLQRARATHVVRDRLGAFLRFELGRRLGVSAQSSAEQFLAANATHAVVDKDGLAHVLQQMSILESQKRPDQESLLRLSRETYRLLQHKTGPRKS